LEELNVTFFGVLVAVWNRIIINENATEIKRRLNKEMLDCVEDGGIACLVGRISRLINCLSGFDVMIKVGIADAEQIGAIISIVKDRLIMENSYSVALHKSIVQDQLRELNYDQTTIDLWLTHITATIRH
jgi:hypothetical protein